MEAGHLRQGGRHLFDEVRLGPAPFPLGIRFQADAALDMRRGEGLGALVVAADLRHHVGHFVELLHPVAEFVRHQGGFLQGDARRRLHLDPDAALVESRQEVLAHRDGEHAHQHEDAPDEGEDPLGTEHRAGGEAFVFLRQGGHHLVVVDLLRLAVERISKTRNQDQGHGEGAQQGITHGVSHRGEELLLNALEGKERHVGHDDDDRGEEDGLGHVRDPAYRAAGIQRFIRSVLPQFEQGLRHHDRSIHQDTEIDGAQREEVRRNAGEVHQDEGDQQGDGDGGGHDQGAVRAPEEDQQDADNQQHTEEERVLDGAEGGSHELGPVQERTDAHALGEHVGIQFVHGRVDFLQDRGRVLVAEHLDDALHAVVDGMLVVQEAHHAFSLEVAVFEFAEVGKEDRRAVDGFHDDAAEVFEVLDQAHPAHNVTLFAGGQHAAAAVGVIVFDGLLHLGQGEAIFEHTVRIDFQLELRGQAAEVADRRHARDLLQPGNDHPLVQVSEFPQGMIVALQDIAIDLPRRGGQRIQLRGRVVRQVHALDALPHPLAGPVVLRAIVEDQDDDGQAEGVPAAHHIQRRDAVQRPLQGDGDLLFDLLGRQAGDLGHHLHGHVGDVRIGIDREPRPAIDAECGNDQKRHGHQPAASQGEFYQLVHRPTRSDRCRQRR